MSVVTMTIVWSVGLAAFVPTAVLAEDCPELEAGELFKVEGSTAVYLLNADMERMYFPSSEIFHTWYEDFSGVTEIANTCVDMYPAPDSAPYGVNYRPGSYLVKVQISPSVYVVESGNKRTKIGSEGAAKAMYGDNWASKVRDISDVYWPNFASVGTELTEATLTDGMVVTVDGETNYAVVDGMLYEVDGTVENVQTISQDLLDTLEMGSTTVTAASLREDPAQLGNMPTTDTGDDTTTPALDGDLTVSLSANTPDAGNVVTGGNANMLALNFKAGNEAVNINKLTITRYGLSGSNDIENIKMLDSEGVSYGNVVTALSSNGRARLTFTTPIVVPANGSATYYVRAGVPSSGATTGNTIILGVASASDIESSNASVGGSYPIKGNTMNIVNTTVGSATVSANITVSDTTPDVGDTNVVLNNFKVVGGSTEDVTIESMTFLEAGTAKNADYGTLRLYDTTGNVKLGEVSWNAEGKAHFAGLDYVVEKGKTARFELRTDVLGGSGLTMNADLIDGSDTLMAVKGNTYGFYLTPTIGSSWNGKGGSDQTIAAGSLTIGISANSPGTGAVTQGDEQLLGVFSFDVKGEESLVSAFEVNYDLAGSPGTLLYTEVTSNILKDADGNVVAGPLDTASGGVVSFTDNFIVPVGQNDYYLYATIADTAGTGDTIEANIDAAADVTVKGYTTGSDIDAGGSYAVTASTLTVGGAVLNAVTRTTPAARSIADGVNDLVWMTGSISAPNSGERAVVTTIVIEDTLGDSADDANDINNVEIWADLTADSSVRGDAYETKISDTKQFVDSADSTTDETLSFTLSPYLTVEKNGEVLVAVIADLAAGATTGDTHTLSFDTDAGDVTGYGENTGNTVNATPTGSGQTFEVAGAGTLTLTVDSSSPSAKLIAGGATGETLGVFRLAASNVENLDLDSFKITDDGSDNGVLTYKFYVGDKLLGSVTGGATAELFLADDTQLVPANGNIKVTVKGDMASVDGTTVANASTAAVTVSSTGDIDTTGKASGDAVDSTQTSVDAATHYLYNAYPTVEFANDTPGGTLIPNSNALIGKLAVSAVGNDDITFEETTGTITFQLAVTRADETGNDTLTLKNADGDVLYTTTTVEFGTTTEFQAVFDSTEFTVPAGETKYLYVYADTADFEDTGDSIQLWIDAATDDIDWSINGNNASYSHGDLIFQGNKYGGALNKS